MIEIDVEPYYILSQQHDLLTIIDNTFLTPYLSTPLEDGADIVLIQQLNILVVTMMYWLGLYLLKMNH